MARFQTGIVWEDGAQQFFGIFQNHEAALCGNVGHTQYSFFNRSGLNWNLKSLFRSGPIVNYVSFARSPRSGRIPTLESKQPPSFGERNLLLESYEGELKIRLRSVGSRRFQP